MTHLGKRRIQRNSYGSLFLRGSFLGGRANDGRSIVHTCCGILVSRKHS